MTPIDRFIYLEVWVAKCFGDVQSLLRTKCKTFFHEVNRLHADVRIKFAITAKRCILKDWHWGTFGGSSFFGGMEVLECTLAIVQS